MELKVEKVKDFARYFSCGTNQVSHHVIIHNHINNISCNFAYWCNWAQVRRLRFLVDTLTLVRVDNIEETIPKVLQTVNRYYQCVNVTCCLAVIISECESKLKYTCK